jgi:hypothetical protein
MTGKNMTGRLEPSFYLDKQVQCSRHCPVNSSQATTLFPSGGIYLMDIEDVDTSIDPD